MFNLPLSHPLWIYITKYGRFSSIVPVCVQCMQIKTESEQLQNISCNLTVRVINMIKSLLLIQGRHCYSLSFIGRANLKHVRCKSIYLLNQCLSSLRFVDYLPLMTWSRCLFKSNLSWVDPIGEFVSIGTLVFFSNSTRWPPWQWNIIQSGLKDPSS